VIAKAKKDLEKEKALKLEKKSSNRFAGAADLFD